MYLKTALLFSMVASAMAVPTTTSTTPGRHQQKRQEGSILTVQDYSEFQISDGVAGNALAEVQAKFPIDESNLASVSASDLAIIKAARKTAENAETQAGGFNEAIEAVAGGTIDSEEEEEGRALQVGKIKNKVLKLKLFSLALQIEQAQGDGDDDSVADKLAETLEKLDKNVAQDEEAAGEESRSVNFQGTSEP